MLYKCKPKSAPIYISLDYLCFGVDIGLTAPSPPPVFGDLN